jgi:GNAT superfamily N-acetyltransferase
MTSFSIAPFSLGEENDYSSLIRRVFDEFVAPGYTAEGNRFFSDYIDPAKIAERSRNGNLLLGARHNNVLIGIIEIRDRFHICLFFVEKSWQGMGVARAIFDEAKRLCLEGPGAPPEFLEVNASPYSEKIYGKLGFKKTQELQELNGMKFVPMKMAIKSGLLHTGRISVVRRLTKAIIRHPVVSLLSAIVVALVTSVGTIRYTTNLQRDLQSMYGNDLVGQNYLQTARITLLTLENDINILFLLPDSPARDSIAREIAQKRSTIDNLLKKAKPLSRSKRGTAVITTTMKLFAESDAQIDSAIVFTKKNEKRKGSAAGLTGDIRKRFAKIDASLNRIDQYKLKRDATKYRTINFTLTVSILFTVVTLIMTVFFKIFSFHRARKKKGVGR